MENELVKIFERANKRFLKENTAFILSNVAERSLCSTLAQCLYLEIKHSKYILKELSQRLTQQFGRGYSYDNLKLMRKFYLVYSKDSIGETPFPQSEKLPVTQEGRQFYLSWSHYLILM